LDGRSGVHAPWDINDSTVGLIYDEETTVIHNSETLFETDWSAFPRAPLIADLSVKKNGGETRMTVVVLHLKAFKDSVDRRREACAKLVAYIEQHPDHEYVVLGDFNDDPNDSPSENSFVDTFLDAEPAYHFVTQVLAPETVTSTGYYHYVNGTKITGEFLDHAVVTGGLHSTFSSVTATVLAKPANEFSAWKDQYSDHFPVMISFNP
jgi:endonuclease/exonuclease/phosphatase family metal-dependent hydrolase